MNAATAANAAEKAAEGTRPWGIVICRELPSSEGRVAVLNPRVLISGVHGGVNPGPGLGVARSIRLAWPDARIEALDYSIRSTGLSASIFDDIHIWPQWADVDRAVASQELVELLERTNAVFLPGLDVEIEALANVLSGNSRVIAPPLGAIGQIVKPAESVARMLSMRVPMSVSFTSLSDAIDFGSKCGWPIWAKGPRKDALIVSRPSDLADVIDRLSSECDRSSIVLQQHIIGYEESIAFSAISGRLVSAIYMIKTMTTAEGKTWAGTFEPLSMDDYQALCSFVSHAFWSGGGEVEIVREVQTRRRYLLDVNPRFPAWIHGSSLAGVNLPARLLQEVTGAAQASLERSRSSSFVRIVEEVPARYGYLPEPAARHLRSGAQDAKDRTVVALPPDLRLLTRSGRRRERAESLAATISDPHRFSSVVDAAWHQCERRETPQRIFLPSLLSERTATFRRIADKIALVHGVDVDIAYSVKTNPDPRILRAIRDAGLMAEAISFPEIQRCLNAGFTTSDIVLSGPGKWWRAGDVGLDGNLAGIYCDSERDLDCTLDKITERSIGTNVLGVRLAPIRIPSRFGFQLDEPSAFRGLAQKLSRIPSDLRLGVHFHLASHQVGADAWRRELTSVLEMAAALSDAVGIEVDVVDIGGGFSPSSLTDGDMQVSLEHAVNSSRDKFSKVRSILVEPGRILSQPSMGLVATVLDIIPIGKQRAAVVDASIAELPDYGSHLYPVLWRSSNADNWYLLSEGSDTFLGRLCMENDEPRPGIQLPDKLSPGDLVAFLDAGGYDASMSYRFGE